MTQGNFPGYRTPDHKTPWVLVVRMGGIGDCLIASSILPALKGQGYKIAFMGKEPKANVLENNPHIDRLILMPDSFEPESWFDFFEQQHRLYDRVINLFGTVEGTLLARPEYVQFLWEPLALRATCNVNYLERTHACAGVPPPFVPAFYPSQAEDDEAQVFADTLRPAPVIGMPVSGSAVDKVSPHLSQIAVKLVARTGATVILMAEDNDKEKALVNAVLADARKWGDASRIKHTMNRSLRWTMSLAQHCDVLVGPDTGMMWSVAMNPKVGKVVMLSHATPENITKHWVRTTAITAKHQLAPCWPCHKVHIDFSHCFEHGPTKTAMCMQSQSPAEIIDAVIAHLE
jgi:ADP-heptose:LPS heptosyltransferase